MTLEEQISALKAENAALREALAIALERIAELEQGKKQQSSFVKPNKPKKAEPKAPRRQRKAEHNRGRRREEPTKIVSHKLEACPDCGCRMHGQSVARRRQVIELPPPQPVEITEHRVIKRWCPKCGRWHTPKLDLRGQVLGQGRLGVRLISLIAHLRAVLRLPVRVIQRYLETIHQVTISIGEITAVLDQVRQHGQSTLQSWREQLRRSPVVHGDETGWREDGQNGYVWTFSTVGRDAVRYYERHASRAGAIVRRVLGSNFQGILSSDFYGAYNEHKGRHQRCWVHLLRDLHKLKDEQAGNQEIVAWAQKVRALHDDAQVFLQGSPAPNQAEREAEYGRLMQRLQPLGLAYAKAKGHPCWGLAKRLLRHQDELFQFVLVEGLPADNNLAERSLRPVVVMRKISGGSRSKRGSDTRMALASLFGTWQARGLNPFAQCYGLLSLKT